MLPRVLTYAIISLVLMCGVVHAQAKALGETLAEEDDKGFLTLLLQDSLGGEGRIVNITGFQGALSRQATMSQITIADRDGVWLTLQGITMEWNRRALLRGRVEIQRLSADALLLDRMPIQEDTGLPAPEAAGFSLPDLPVALLIDELAVERIRLGAPILGEPAEMTLQASAQLVEGSAAVDLEARRPDGPDGQFLINARYDAADERVALSLNLTEAADGIAARLLDIRGRPDLSLTVDGDGPLANLTTQIRLETGGTERLTGVVNLISRNAIGDAPPSRNFTADLSGDLAPLFPEAYQPFFGDEVALQAAGSRAANGALELSQLELVSGASSLNGSLALSPDNWPVRAELTGELQSPDETALRLPVGRDLEIQNATFNLSYDETESEDWTVGLSVVDLTGEAYGAAEFSMSGTGRVTRDQTLSGTLSAEATGLTFDNPDLQTAIGTSVQAALVLDHAGEGELAIRDLELAGSDYRLTGQADIGGLDTEFSSEMDLELTADDLRRFGPILGADLTGRAAVSLKGTADLGGRFDLGVLGTAGDLSTGISMLDPFLAGETQIEFRAIRDTEGTRLPAVSLRNTQLDLTGSVMLKTDASEADFELTVPDATLIAPMLKGSLTARGQAQETPEGWRVSANATGPNQIAATLAGRLTGEVPSVTFEAQIPDLRPLVSSLSGPAKLAGTAFQAGEGWRIDANFEGPYQSSGEISGGVTGPAAPDLKFNARLLDIARLAPGYRGALDVDGTLIQSTEGLQLATDLRGPYGMVGRISGPISGATPLLRFTLRLPNLASLGAPVNGPLALDGTAAQSGGAWRINTTALGPGGTQAQINGTVSGRNAVDMVATGSAPLALANPFLSPRNLQGQARFDLRLSGPMSLSALSGTIETTGARLSAPTYAVALQEISARVRLENGGANLSLTSAVSSGGRIVADGRIGLGRGLPANIRIQLNGVGLTDANLYDTSVDGDLAVAGALSGSGAVLSGRLDLGETQIQIPSSRAVGFTIIPEIVHVNASAAVRQTLNRAGLNGPAQGTAGSGNTPLSLDLTISAPRRIFVRGRGLDAELGGNLRLRGTTQNIISSGQFDLIRGRLDVLGKRFVLDQGRITLQGRLDPAIRFVATTSTDTGTASIVIEGPASQPTVTFTSTPEAPQDEVLAQIFFGRSLTNLSPFQALQLASAVATLAGGGETTLLTSLRRGFALDDLDITSDNDGRTSLRLGKYLTDNVYTDVQISNDNTQELSINVDATQNLVVRGTLHSDGNSSVGVFFEKDY